MKQMKLLCVSIIIAASAVQSHAETQYRWNGTVDSVFTNSANWQASPGPAPYGGTNAESRLSIYNNSANSPLYYTADLGHTIYQNSTGTSRTLFISSGGALYITGGIFEAQPNAQNGLSYNGNGTLMIDGGTYRQKTGNSSFLMKYGGTGTGTLTVSNGLFDVGSVVFGSLSSYNTSGNAIINLDGGTSRVSKIYMNSNAPDGDSVINFNGGRLEATSYLDETHFLEGLKEANILEGGALIDTSSHNITIKQDLLDGGGDGGVTKSGSKILTLSGTNTFSGDVVIEEGKITVENNSALGTVDGSTTVNFGATLELRGGVTITNEPLIIYGQASSYGALAGTSGNNIWNGDVLLGQNDSRISANNGSKLTINGVIDDGASSYDVQFRGSGTGITTLSGENTYGGKTEVVVATLQLDGGDNRLPIGTQLIIGNSSNVDYAIFDLNGCNQEVAMLDDLGDMTNSVIDSAGGGSLTVNDSGNRTFAGNFIGPLTLVKTNSNVLTLDGDMQATSIAVNQGRLQGSATWHCLFNDADTPNQMIVTNGTLDISSMTFDYDENTPAEPGSYVIVDYSAGGSLTATPTAPFFAAAEDMPERGSLIHDTANKQILFVYGMEGTLILIQ